MSDLENPIMMAVDLNVEKNTVVIRFPKELTWISFSPEIARKLAKIIVQKVHELEALQTKH